MIDPADLEKTLTASFTDSTVRVRDLTGTGDHFEAIVVTPDFVPLNRVEQHQRVYKALDKTEYESLHALALKTMTPAEYAREFPGETNTGKANTGSAPSTEPSPPIRLPIVKGPS